MRLLAFGKSLRRLWFCSHCGLQNLGASGVRGPGSFVAVSSLDGISLNHAILQHICGPDTGKHSHSEQDSGTCQVVMRQHMPPAANKFWARVLSLVFITNHGNDSLGP